MKNILLALAIVAAFIGCRSEPSKNQITPHASPISSCAQRTNSNPTDAMSSGDCIVFTDSTSNAIVETLPAPTPGRWLRVKDKTGQAGAHNVTITQHASETIDGQTSIAIMQAYGAVDLITDGTNWSVDNPPHLAGNVVGYGSANTVVAINNTTVPAGGSLATLAPLIANGPSAAIYGPALVYAQDWPSLHGFLEWNDSPTIQTTHTTAASGAVLLFRILANQGGTVSNVVMSYASVGTTLTAAATGSITNAVSSGGLIEITQTAHGYATGYVITISGVTGTTEANGAWVITVVDANDYTLNNSTFVHAYVSGGTAVNSSNVIGLYDSTGNFLTATGDLVSAWENATLSALVEPFATPVTLTQGNTYTVAVLSKGSGTQPGFQVQNINSTSFQTVNAGLTAANFRYATNPGSGASRLPASILYSANVATNNALFWVALK